MEVNIASTIFSKNNGHDLEVRRGPTSLAWTDLSEEDLAAIAIAIIDHLVEISKSND